MSVSIGGWPGWGPRQPPPPSLRVTCRWAALACDPGTDVVPMDTPPGIETVDLDLAGGDRAPETTDRQTGELLQDLIDGQEGPRGVTHRSHLCATVARVRAG